MKQWYAVHCKPQQDGRAELQLLNQAFDVFRPLVRVRRYRRGKVHDVKESMFPRYLFIRLDDADENWGPIRSPRGVNGMVRWGNHVPVVPEAVILRLRESVAEDACVDMTHEDAYRPNEPVRITEGPFTGYDALYQARNGQERVVVLLEIMQQSQRLVLPDTSIAKQ